MKNSDLIARLLVLYNVVGKYAEQNRLKQIEVELTDLHLIEEALNDAADTIQKLQELIREVVTADEAALAELQAMGIGRFAASVMDLSLLEKLKAAVE